MFTWLFIWLHLSFHFHLTWPLDFSFEFLFSLDFNWFFTWLFTWFYLIFYLTFRMTLLEFSFSLDLTSVFICSEFRLTFRMTSPEFSFSLDFSWLSHDFTWVIIFTWLALDFTWLRCWCWVDVLCRNCTWSGLYITIVTSWLCWRTYLLYTRLWTTCVNCCIVFIPDTTPSLLRTRYILYWHRCLFFGQNDKLVSIN